MRATHYNENFKIFFRQTQKLISANLKSRYRGTWSGFLWVIMHPVLTYGAQSYAFHYILKLDVTHYPLFLVTGLLPWIFLSTSLEMSTPALINQAKMLKSFPVSPYALVCAQIADNFINYLAAFLLMLLPIGYYFNWPFINLIFMLLPLVSLFLFVASGSFLLSLINVMFRDTKFIVSFVVQISYFLTPIFYPVELIPDKFKWVADVNIFYSIIRPLQMLHQDFQMNAYWVALLKSFATSLFMAFLTWTYWRRKRNEIYFHF